MDPDRRDEVSELLWNYIESGKSADRLEARNFVVRTEVDPTELAPLLLLADTVQEQIQAESSAHTGMTAARARLTAAIRAERGGLPRQAGSARPVSLLSRWWARQALLTLVLVLLSGVAYYVWAPIIQHWCAPPRSPAHSSRRRHAGSDSGAGPAGSRRCPPRPPHMPLRLSRFSSSISPLQEVETTGRDTVIRSWNRRGGSGNSVPSGGSAQRPSLLIRSTSAETPISCGILV